MPEPSVAPVLISVAVKVALLSASVSFSTTSFDAPSVTVKEVSDDISIVLLSFAATGVSLVPVTVKVNVDVSVSVPSVTV